MSKCQHCPLNGKNVSCISDTHPRYCELIAMGREDYSEYVEQASLERNQPETVGVSFMEKAVSFASAAVTHTANGFSQTPKDIAAERLKICQGCSFFDRDRKQCQKCGCNMTYKVTWGSMRCPIGLWEAI